MDPEEVVTSIYVVRRHKPKICTVNVTPPKIKNKLNRLIGSLKWCNALVYIVNILCCPLIDFDGVAVTSILYKPRANKKGLKHGVQQPRRSSLYPAHVSGAQLQRRPAGGRETLQRSTLGGLHIIKSRFTTSFSAHLCILSGS